MKNFVVNLADDKESSAETKWAEANKKRQSTTTQPKKRTERAISFATSMYICIKRT